MRTARIARKTNETDITLTICLDGRGVSAIQSGVGFLDHMLTLLARHGRLDLELTCRGDPYNVNRLTLRAGAAALAEQDYYDANCAAIVDTRADTKRRLEALGFTCTDSRANFLFARHPAADGGDLYRRLKERGVLVRRFDAPRIGDYIRITIGTRAQMDALLERLEGLL